MVTLKYLDGIPEIFFEEINVKNISRWQKYTTQNYIECKELSLALYRAPHKSSTNLVQYPILARPKNPSLNRTMTNIFLGVKQPCVSLLVALWVGLHSVFVAFSAMGGVVI